MMPRQVDIAGLIHEAQNNCRPIPMTEACMRLGPAWCEHDLASETVLVRGDDVVLPPTTWLRLLHRVLARQRATPPLELLAPLSEPSLTDLIRLLCRVQHRRVHTKLEQVAREVGSRAYDEMLTEVWDRPVVIRHGQIIGLPSGTYAIALQAIIYRRFAEESTVAMEQTGG